MKKIIISVIITLCVISLYPFSAFAEAKALSWYCVRNKEHKQPLADSNMRFVEDYGGFYIDRKHSDSAHEKVIYLTFDAGYENGNIEKILNTLKEEKVPAAFFILKNLVIKEPELVKRMADEGHLVCNHTANHPDITKFKTKEELKKELLELETFYNQATNRELAKYFRPPEGRFSVQSMRFTEELGYKTIFWSFAYADWDNDAQMSESAAKAKIFDNLHNGEIMLLHPTSATNANILQDVIKQLRSEGYRFGTLDELTQ